MPIHTILPLIIGIVFLAVGLLTLKFSPRPRNIFGLIPTVLGGIMVGLATFGPLSKVKERFNEVRSLKTDSIIALLIHPSNDINYENSKSLTKTVKTISDSTTIDEIAKSLQSAIETDLVIKNPDWTSTLEIRKKDSTSIFFEIRHGQNNCTIDFYSNKDDGWHYGTLTTDDICNIISQASK